MDIFTVFVCWLVRLSTWRWAQWRQRLSLFFCCCCCCQILSTLSSWHTVGVKLILLIHFMSYWTFKEKITYRLRTLILPIIFFYIRKEWYTCGNLKKPTHFANPIHHTIIPLRFISLHSFHGTSWGGEGIEVSVTHKKMRPTNSVRLKIIIMAINHSW